MKINRFMAVAFGATLLVASSCMQEDAVNLESEISPEVLAAFDKAGFNTADIVKYRYSDNIAGDMSGYMVGGDVFVSEEQVFELGESVEIPGSEQYRTNALVNNNQTISVIGYTGGANALTSRGQTALSWAVANYNRLNIGLNFTLTTGTNYQSYDIVVYKATDIAIGGAAGFPQGGQPYQLARIGYNMDQYSTNVNEHVITHEMGHCLGFRHTDYFNRSISCGSGGNEGSSGVGAVHVPGTGTTNNASGFDFNSIMLACFSSSEDGEFSSQDVTAFEYLY